MNSQRPIVCTKISVTNGNKGVIINIWKYFTWDWSLTKADTHYNYKTGLKEHTRKEELITQSFQEQP